MDKEVKEAIIKLLLEGKSNRYIRDKLGVTIGQAAGTRHRLFQAQPELKPKPRVKWVPDGGCVPQPKIAVRHKKHPGPRHLSIMNLQSHHCRFVEDVGLYCAADVASGRSYCHAHCVRMYTKYAVHQKL